MGLTIFAVLMTLGQARPVKLSAPLKFVLGSIFGFAVGWLAGLAQANIGLSVVLHNTQWAIGAHAHMLLLGGLSMLFFAVIYALLPILTGLEIKSARLVNAHFWAWLPGAVAMSYALGQAGTRGMLRPTIYTNGLYTPQMAVALAGALLMAAGLVFFLANLIATLGLRNVIGLFLPGRKAAPQAEPAC